jgi:deoxyribonuclease-4
VPRRRRPSPVGAHIRVAGGLATTGLAYARQVGAEAVQVFVSNPRGWAPAAGDPAQDRAFRAGCAAAGLPVFVHAPYLVNLASPNPLFRERSVASVAHSLARGRVVGARGVVVHAGSAVDAEHRDRALQLMRDLLLPLLDRLTDDDPAVLVEPSAGGGLPVAADLPGLAALFDTLDRHPRLGVALDTCHLYAAGHDLARPGGMRAALNFLSRHVGQDRLRLVHANDSKDPCGSCRDRHANIGAGYIGVAPFAELFRHAAVSGVPVLVETPGEASGHAADIALLKQLRDGTA